MTLRQSAPGKTPQASCYAIFWHFENLQVFKVFKVFKERTAGTLTARRALVMFLQEGNSFYFLYWHNLTEGKANKKDTRKPGHGQRAP